MRPGDARPVRALLARAPEPLKAAHADLVHRVRWRRSHIARVTRAYVRAHGRQVQNGPFAGMAFPAFAVERGVFVVAQLLGAYERELHPALRDVVADAPDVVVDIGASDGYYAVGLARALPAARVLAYEMSPFPARVCRALAAENGVGDRVDVRGECRVEDLARLPAGRLFVLCDAEGAEDRLMDPDAAPALRDARLVVEVHEFAAAGVGDRLRARFASSHEIEAVRSTWHHTGDYPLLEAVPGIDYMDRELAVSEFRHSPISWLVMTPRGPR
jgi:hypothetical protein